MQLPVAPVSPVAVRMKAVSSWTCLKTMPDAKEGLGPVPCPCRGAAGCSSPLDAWAHLLSLGHSMPARCSVDNTPSVGGEASSCPRLNAPGVAAR